MKRAHRPSPRAVSAWLRLAAALALALLAGDHVLPSLHYAFVAHEMCPEHGMLEHVGARSSALSHRDGAPSYEASTAGDEHHDHCGSVPASPPRAPFVAGSAATTVLVAAELDRAVPYAARVFSADVVAFAPKQSPPA